MTKSKTNTSARPALITPNRSAAGGTDALSEPVTFEDFEDAASLSSSTRDLLAENGHVVRIRQKNDVNHFAAVVIPHNKIVKQAESCCKKYLKAQANQVIHNGLKCGYQALAELSWEMDRTNSSLVWYNQTLDAVNKIYGRAHPSYKAVETCIDAVASGVSRKDFLFDETTPPLPLHDDSVDPDPFQLHDLILTATEILQENKLDSLMENFFGDLIGGTFGKIPKNEHYNITVLCSRHYYRIGKKEVAIAQVKEGLAIVKKLHGKKSPEVAWLGLELCDLYMLTNNHKAARSVFTADIQDAIAKISPESKSTLSYLSTLLREKAANSEEVDMMLAVLRRSVSDAIHPEEQAQTFQTVVERTAQMVVAGLRIDKQAAPTKRASKRTSWFAQSTKQKQKGNFDLLKLSLLSFITSTFRKTAVEWRAADTLEPVKKLACLIRIHELTRTWPEARRRPSSNPPVVLEQPAAAPTSKKSDNSGKRKSLRGSLGKLMLGGTAKSNPLPRGEGPATGTSTKRTGEAKSTQDKPSSLEQGQDVGHTPRTFKDILVQFYSRFAPEKLPDVDTIIVNFLGREDQLIHALELKYGVRLSATGFVPLDDGKKSVPFDIASVESGVSYKDTLTRFFQQYRPKKVKHVDALLQEYRGRESELVFKLETKYSVRFHNDGTFVQVDPNDPSKQQFHPSQLKDDTFYNVLCRFYKAYCPEKKDSVQDIVKQFKGRESTLIHTLELKYAVRFCKDGIVLPQAEFERAKGKTPKKKDKGPPKRIEDDHGEWRRVLCDFYAHFAPEKLSDVDEILDRFKGKEDLLMTTLELKYGVSNPTRRGSRVSRASMDSGRTQRWGSRSRHGSEVSSNPASVVDSSDDGGDAESVSTGRRASRRIQLVPRDMAPDSDVSHGESFASSSTWDGQSGDEEREDDWSEASYDSDGWNPTLPSVKEDLASELHNIAPHVLESCLEAFFQVYYPEQLSMVNKLLEQFRGREMELVCKLESDYGIRINESGAASRISGVHVSLDGEELLRGAVQENDGEKRKSRGRRKSRDKRKSGGRRKQSTASDKTRKASREA